MVAGIKHTSRYSRQEVEDALEESRKVLENAKANPTVITQNDELNFVLGVLTGYAITSAIFSIVDYGRNLWNSKNVTPIVPKDADLLTPEPAKVSIEARLDEIAQKASVKQEITTPATSPTLKGKEIPSFDVKAMETAVQLSKNPLETSREFLQSFIQQFNAQNNTTLSFEKACGLIRENIHNLQLSSQEQNSILQAIMLFEGNSPKVLESTPVSTGAFINPLQWFGSSKTKNKKSHSRPSPLIVAFAANTNGAVEELPGNVYIGAAEMLGGALICVLGLVFPPAGAAGLVVVGDGMRRVLDGLNDLNDDRKAVLRK